MNKHALLNSALLAVFYPGLGKDWLERKKIVSLVQNIVVKSQEGVKLFLNHMCHVFDYEDVMNLNNL